MNVLRYIASWTILALFACSDDQRPANDLAAGGTTHIAASRDTIPAVTMQQQPSTQPESQREDSGLSAVNLDQSSLAFQIGEEHGDGTQAFGHIRDVAVDDAGNVFVLDEQELTVRWFDARGAFRGTAGRAGRGPGEFRAPMTLSSPSTGTIQVLDMAQRSIATFTIRDSAMHLVRTMPLPLTPMGFCTVGGVYYILSKPTEGSIITAVDSAGRVLRSFGPPLGEIPETHKQHESLFRELQTRGRLLCTEAPATIIFFPEGGATIRAFSPTGKSRWTTTLANYHAVRRVATSRNGRSGFEMAPDPATGTAHTGGFLMQLNDSLVGLNLTESSMSNPEGDLEVRVLSITDGRELGSYSQSSALVARRNGMLYTVEQHPYPRVRVMRVKPE